MPGGGPSLDGSRWVTAKHPTQTRRRQPFLVDNCELAQAFRKHFVRGLRRLLRKGQLQVEDDWSFLQNQTDRDNWLSELQATDWNVFIEGPPRGNSKPEHVIKYLARYLTGGPISNKRLISDVGNESEGDEPDGRVTFWARGKQNSAKQRSKKRRKNRSEPYELSGREFVRRWSMHVLPKRFTRSRSYGGYHNSKREAYLGRCRSLLGGSDDSIDEHASDISDVDETASNRSVPTCRHCHTEMTCVEQVRRPSWKQIFERDLFFDGAPYCPIHHLSVLASGRRPLQPQEYG